MTTGRFEGRVALVTGAAGGFGRRVCERLADDGAKLVISDIDQSALDELRATLPEGTVAVTGNVAEEELSERLVKEAGRRFGRLDIAINNAGIAQSFVKLPQVPSDEARRIIDIDLMGVFYAMKHQIPLMEKQFRKAGSGGTIVNIASVAGLVGAARLSVYAAAKHGVVGLTRSAAAEYASRGIRVNAVCPSFARTNMVGDFVKMAGTPADEALSDLTRGVPMKRVAEVDEVVEVILFAADPRNSFMTGHCLSVDGGIMAI
ncbi:MAG: SDR family oxidoreductase [Rhizobiaceae bacterium]|nr:SDR family oxidoreductase [Rhizobiaceae bacterium]MCV0408453.1 SDR family oxidoreductase [Rhizobiaceae bacterium]